MRNTTAQSCWTISLRSRGRAPVNAPILAPPTRTQSTSNRSLTASRARAEQEGRARRRRRNPYRVLHAQPDTGVTVVGPGTLPLCKCQPKTLVDAFWGYTDGSGSTCDACTGSQRCFSKTMRSYPRPPGYNQAAFSADGYGCIDESGPVHTGSITMPGVGTYNIEYEPSTYQLTVIGRRGGGRDRVLHAQPDTGVTVVGPATPCV